MGVGKSESVFSSKWVTALVVDEQNIGHRFPIRDDIGDYFLAKINHQLYAFRILRSRIILPPKMADPWRILLYTTKSYVPISPQNNKDLENVVRENNLPKMNRMLHKALTMLGKREKNEFKVHELDDLVSALKEDPEANDEKIRNIITFIDDLDTRQIVTPVKDVSEFIQGDLIEPDPKFMASVPEIMVQAEIVHHKVTNTPIKPKKNWIKWVILATCAALIIGLVAYFISSGTLQLPSFSSGGFGTPFQFGGSTSANDLMKQYPDPEQLKAACDQHKLDCSNLPPEVKKMLDAYKPPTVTPKSSTVNLTP